MLCGALISILGSPKLEPNHSLLSLLWGFSFQIWILILLSFVTLFLLNLAKEAKFGLLEVLSNLLGFLQVLLMQSLKSKKCYLITFWSFAAFFITLFFKNDVVANLTIQIRSEINSLEDIIKDESVVPYIKKSTYRYIKYLRVRFGTVF